MRFHTFWHAFGSAFGHDLVLLAHSRDGMIAGRMLRWPARPGRAAAYRCIQTSFNGRRAA